MPTCQNCGKHFKNFQIIEGKKRNFQRRRFCLECSPFKMHNTKKDLNNTTKKKCKYCEETNIENFYKNVKNICKSCYNQKCIIYQRKNKEKYIKLKGGKCENCGYNKCISALEFHHIDSEKKDKSIRFTTCNEKRVLEELAHCILVCANCHREIHEKLNKNKHTKNIEASI